MHADLLQQCSTRQQYLAESFVLNQLSRDLSEAAAFLEGKLVFATDTSYRDLRNLDAKLKKWQAFEAELGVTSTRVSDLVGRHVSDDEKQRNQALVERIETQVTDLSALWTKLREASALKGFFVLRAHRKMKLTRNT
jgi:hypothetical protein